MYPVVPPTKAYAASGGKSLDAERGRAREETRCEARGVEELGEVIDGNVSEVGVASSVDGSFVARRGERSRAGGGADRFFEGDEEGKFESTSSGERNPSAAFSLSKSTGCRSTLFSLSPSLFAFESAILLSDLQLLSISSSSGNGVSSSEKFSDANVPTEAAEEVLDSEISESNRSINADLASPFETPPDSCRWNPDPLRAGSTGSSNGESSCSVVSSFSTLGDVALLSPRPNEYHFLPTGAFSDGVSDGLRDNSVEESRAEAGVSERGDVPPSIVLVVVGGISSRGKEWVEDFERSIDVETSTAIGIVIPNASCSSSSALRNASAPFSARRSSSARSNLSTSLVKSLTSLSALLLAFRSSDTILLASSNNSTDRFSSSPIRSSLDFSSSAFLATSVAEEDERAVLEERRVA